MKPLPVYVGFEMDDQGVGAAMDVDLDGDPLDLLEDTQSHKNVDADFFNSCVDDFDDADLDEFVCRDIISKLQKCCENCQYKSKHCGSLTNILGPSKPKA